MRRTQVLEIYVFLVVDVTTTDNLRPNVGPTNLKCEPKLLAESLIPPWDHLDPFVDGQEPLTYDTTSYIYVRRISMKATIKEITRPEKIPTLRLTNTTT